MNFKEKEIGRLIDVAIEYSKSDIKKGIGVLEDTSKLINEDVSKSIQGAFYRCIGNLCSKNGKYEKSTDYLKHSLACYKSTNELRDIASVYNLLGNNALKIKDGNKAYEYYKLCIPINEELQDDRGKSIIYNNLGIVYSYLGNLKKALEYYKKSATIEKKLNNEEEYVKRMYNCADVLFKQENIIESRKILKRIERIIDKGRFYDVKVPLLITLASTSKNEEKLNYLKEADILAKDIGLVDYSDVVNRELAAYYADQKEYEKAYLYAMNFNEQIELRRWSEVNKKLNDIHTGILFEESQKQFSEMERFTGMVAHDLKEPVRMINSYSQILSSFKEEIKDDKIHYFINIIKESGLRIEKIIDDLLQFSRMKNENFEMIEIDLNKILNLVLSGVAMLIEESNTKIVFEELPIIKGNETMLYQLFQNLISNGIKYNVSEKKIISITAESNDKECIIKFVDNGVGIATKDLGKIFNSFSRVANPSKSKGTGLGLTICQTIVNRHRGKMMVSSKLNKGTTFSIVFQKINKN